jgi:glucose-6-phosphate 1-epimerase
MTGGQETPEKLNNKFGDGETVIFKRGAGDLVFARLQHSSGFSAEIYLLGATITGWRDPASNDLLFVSSRAVFKEGKAIRGGIPVVFPQFSGPGPLPNHGIARTAMWRVVRSGIGTEGDIQLELSLQSDDSTRKVWNREFELRYLVSLSQELTTEFSVINRDTKSDLEFENALHTYFKVRDISRVSVKGLAGLKYLDNTQQRKEGSEERAAIRIEGEIDRVYVNAPDSLEIHDEASRKVITVQKSGMSDAVLWNPWIEKAKELSDLGDEDYQEMVCLEAGNVSRKEVVRGGETWSCTQTLSVRTL